MRLQPSNHGGKGSGETTKALRVKREKKNASKEQGLAEVGLLAELLSKLRAAHKGGNSWDSFQLYNALNDYVLTPRGQRGEGHTVKVR